jgi:hypothetical protein
MTPTKAAILVAAAALIAKTQAQSFFEDFNTAGSYANNFNVFSNATPAGANPYSQSTTSGVGGSGGIDVSNATGTTPDSTSIYKNSTFNFANSGSSLTVSAMMKIVPTAENGNRLLQLGFVNDPTSGMNGNAGFAFTSMRFNPPATIGGAGAVPYTPQWQTKTAAGSTVATAGAPSPVNFTTGNWYLMSLTFVNNGGGSIGGSGFVQDFGTDGLTLGATTQLTPVSLSSADIAADATVYAAFRGFKGDGLGNVDNFAATQNVPEPSTIALFGLSGALFLARRRRS